MLNYRQAKDLVIFKCVFYKQLFMYESIIGY